MNFVLVNRKIAQRFLLLTKEKNKEWIIFFKFQRGKKKKRKSKVGGKVVWQTTATTHHWRKRNDNRLHLEWGAIETKNLMRYGTTRKESSHIVSMATYI